MDSQDTESDQTSTNTDTAKADSVKTEPVKTKPVKTEPVKTKPITTGPTNNRMLDEKFAEGLMKLSPIIKQSVGPPPSFKTKVYRAFRKVLGIAWLIASSSFVLFVACNIVYGLLMSMVQNLSSLTAYESSVYDIRNIFEACADSSANCTISDVSINPDSKYSTLYINRDGSTTKHTVLYDTSHADLVNSLQSITNTTITPRFIQTVEPFITWNQIMYFSLILFVIATLVKYAQALCMAGLNSIKVDIPGIGGVGGVSGIGNLGDLKFVIHLDERTRFSDVSGLTEAKEEIMKIAHMVRNADLYKVIGATLPKGVLLNGPPGCGKTLLARALAGELGIPFISINAAEFDEKLVGVGVQRVKKMFEEARRQVAERGACIVFIDEIDAIGRKRINIKDPSGTLNMILTELDGFSQNESIMVLAATNIVETLDPALTRSGRFDHKIYIDPPNKEDRVDLFKFYLQKLILVDTEKPKDVAVADAVTDAVAVDVVAVDAVIDGAVAQPKDTDPPVYIVTYSMNVNPVRAEYVSAEPISTELISAAPISTEPVRTEPVNVDDEIVKLDEITETVRAVDNVLIYTVPPLQHADDLAQQLQANKEKAIAYASILAKQTPGMTGADISNVCNQAAISAVRAGQTFVTLEHMTNSIDTVGIGLKKKSRKANESDLKIVAYHEAGHALMGLILKDAEKPVKMSIIPRGEGNLGYTMPNISEAGIFSRQQIVSKIIVLLGGRIAEIQTFNKVTTGASDDLQKVRQLAEQYFVSGLSDTYSTMYIDQSSISRMSSAFREKLESNIDNFIRHLTDQTHKLMKHYSIDLVTMAMTLLERETVDFTDLMDVDVDVDAEHNKMASVIKKRDTCEIDFMDYGFKGVDDFDRPHFRL